MLAVETCVRAYARKSGADEKVWGLTALLHDFDYERWPNADHAPGREHPAEGAKILRERGYPEELIRAVMSHADYCNTPRQTPLEHTLFACDELTGFITACVYVRPSKNTSPSASPPCAKTPTPSASAGASKPGWLQARKKVLSSARRKGAALKAFEAKTHKRNRESTAAAKR